MKSATDGSSKFVWLATSLISFFIITSLANAAGVQPRDDKMSVMGKRAAAAVARVNATVSGAGRPTARALTSDEGCINDPECGEEGDEDEEAAPGGQAELSIAVDESGQHIVIGFNDTRGFALNPISVSGFMYSEDGGKTFVDGGQLPSPGNDVIGTTRFPQVFGDPEVKYLGNCVFVYSSILVEKVSDTADVQTMGVHRSRDCGKTWEGPFEVTSVTNPNGIVVGGVPQDAADKEFMDVDPDTGRVMMSWSNFTPAPTALWRRNPYHVLGQSEDRGDADLVAERGGRSDRIRRTGIDSALRGSQQSRVRGMAAIPVPRHVLRLRQFRGAGAFDRQWGDLAAADRNGRVLHHGPGARQRSREYIAIARRGQLARPASRHCLPGLRQQQQR